MKRFFGLFLSVVFLTSSGLIAQQAITLEEIWGGWTLAPKRVSSFNFLKDGRHYTRLENGKVKKYDLTTGDYVDDLFSGEMFEGKNNFSSSINDYSFNSDESKMLISTDKKSIYRRSSLANYFVFDQKENSISPVSTLGKIRDVSFSPDAKKVAFVFENNLYYKDLKSGKTIQITTDGKENAIINGAADWVYEEEFSITKMYEWSGDSKRIAFIKFDESNVKEFTMTLHNDEAYPEYQTFKYPKVGEKNAIVSLHIYELSKDKTKDINLSNEKDIYLPRIQWTQDNNKLCVTKLNRHQNHLQLLLVNAKKGKVTTLLEEKNKYYIDITDHLKFLKNKKEFIWTSEKDGYNHVYLYDMDGNEKKQITTGNFDVTAFYGIDQKNNKIYYQAAGKSPMQREIYSTDIKNGKTKTLANKNGVNSAQFSSTYDYYVLNHSTINTPPEYNVYNRKAKLIRELEDNEALKQRMKNKGVQEVEFFSFETSENIMLNGWMIQPPNMEKDKKYPVFMYQYSGPGSQSVLDSWRGANYWWFQHLAQQGFVIACVDGRGTGARGEEFKKMTYMQLGHYETLDQIEAAKYLGSLDYTDSDKIGIYGWSYGGYMSSLCLFKGNNVFQSAIAVAPVTNWKWYDTVYTERYMRTDDENPDGYKNNSPVYFADRLRGDYLLVHGLADDNVHFQNTAEITNALISANKQFDTYFYPNRNHGINGNNARLHLFTKMTNFLKEKLQGKTITNQNTRIDRP